MATNKQKALAKKVSENIGIPMGKAMRQVGYSESTSLTPERVTETKGWQELMEKHLPDEKVIQTHESALEATKVVSARITGKDADSQTDDFIDVPDYPTRLKAVELAYKVKKKLGEATPIQNNIQVNVDKYVEEV